jgi:hypothetical protein
LLQFIPQNIFFLCKPTENHVPIFDAEFSGESSAKLPWSFVSEIFGSVALFGLVVLFHTGVRSVA